MTRIFRHVLLAVGACLSLLAPLSSSARPIEFSEVSLLVRSHETNPAILQEVRARKLLHPLSAPQENILKSQGADEALMRSLRDANLALSTVEAGAFEAQEQASKKREPMRDRQDESLGEQVRVFDVSYGHSINLNQWGGPSCEIAFQLRRGVGEDVVEPIMVDSYTTAATYRGQGRPDDATTVFDRRDYVSVMSYDHSRVGSIDANNPISIKGVPYLLYPVYGAGGVSLYYVGKSSDSVRLAVVGSRL